MKTLYQKLINEKSDYDRFKNFNKEINSFIVFFWCISSKLIHDKTVSRGKEKKNQDKKLLVKFIGIFFIL